jgi:peptidoglycan/LPS O-acetylase OafA/YrhL
MGDMSYTLYVVHMPMLIFIGGVIMAQSPNHRLPTSPIWVIPAAAIIVPIAWFIHLFVERPFMRRRSAPKLVSARSTPILTSEA